MRDTSRCMSLASSARRMRAETYLAIETRSVDDIYQHIRSSFLNQSKGDAQEDGECQKKYRITSRFRIYAGGNRCNRSSLVFDEFSKSMNALRVWSETASGPTTS